MNQCKDCEWFHKEPADNIILNGFNLSIPHCRYEPIPVMVFYGYGCGQFSSSANELTFGEAKKIHEEQRKKDEQYL